MLLRSAAPHSMVVGRSCSRPAPRAPAAAAQPQRSRPLAQAVGLPGQLTPTVGAGAERKAQRLCVVARAGKNPPPPQEKIEEEDFEEGELEEVELVALAFDISVEKLPQGVTTAAQLCAHVSEIIRKAAPNIPSDKTLEDMGVAENALLVVASTDNDDDPFQPQDDSIFAEILFLDENDATIALDKVIQALEVRGFKAELAEYDDDEMFEDEEVDEEEPEVEPPPPAPKGKKK